MATPRPWMKNQFNKFGSVNLQKLFEHYESVTQEIWDSPQFGPTGHWGPTTVTTTSTWTPQDTTIVAPYYGAQIHMSEQYLLYTEQEPPQVVYDCLGEQSPGFYQQLDIRYYHAPHTWETVVNIISHEPHDRLYTLQEGESLPCIANYTLTSLLNPHQ